MLLCVPFVAILLVLGSAADQEPQESQHSPVVGSIFTNSVGMKLVYVPAGSFQMGSSFDDPRHQYDETPHPVRITKGFRIGVTEVTQAQWKAVLPEDRTGFNADQLPVHTVSLKEATEFCERLSQKERRRYRLPTEAEWEYACRSGAGTDAGDQGGLEEVAWFSRNSGGEAHEAGSKKSNGLGLFDMLGNVSEWCTDRYAEYPEDEAVDPQGPDGTAVVVRNLRVVRGGSYASFPASCRCTARQSSPPSYQLAETGFRVVLEETN